MEKFANEMKSTAEHYVRLINEGSSRRQSLMDAASECEASRTDTWTYVMYFSDGSALEYNDNDHVKVHDAN